MRPAILLFLILVVAGCASPEPEPGPTPLVTPSPSPPPSLPPPSSLVKGVSVSPRSYNATDFPRFFEDAKDVGDIILWGGSFDELANEEGAAHAIPILARQAGFGFAAQVNVEGVDLARATDTLVRYLDLREPDILVLGVEVDRLHEKNASFVDAFAAWYDGAYDAVKERAPATRVFPSFQLEHMGGHTGGLYGGPESSEPAWDLLGKFPKRDLTAFTTYPGLVWRNVSEIPPDHYREAAERAGGPIGFTEVGHFAKLEGAPGWESSEAEQAAFVERFLADAEAIDARLALWLHLHDQPSVPVAPFQHMGLLDDDGSPRQAYDAWTR